MTDTAVLQELQAWIVSTGAERLSIQSSGVVLLEDQTGYRPHPQPLSQHLLERLLTALRQPGIQAIHERAWQNLRWTLVEPPLSQHVTVHLQHQNHPPQSWRQWLDHGWLRSIDIQWITQHSDIGANLLITACHLSAAQHVFDTLLATPRDPGVMFVLSKRPHRGASTLTVLDPDQLPPRQSTAGTHLTALLQRARWVWCDHLIDGDTFHWWMSSSPYSKGRVGVMTAHSPEDIQQRLQHRAQTHHYPWPGWIDGIIHVDAAHQNIHVFEVDPKGALLPRKRSKPGLAKSTTSQNAGNTPHHGQSTSKPPNVTVSRTPPRGQRPTPGSRDRGVIRREPTPPHGVTNTPRVTTSAPSQSPPPLGRIQRTAQQQRTRTPKERRSAPALQRGHRLNAGAGSAALLGQRTDSGRFSSSGLGQAPPPERPKSSPALRRVDILAQEPMAESEELQILSPHDIEMVHGPIRGDQRDLAFDAKTRDMPALSEMASAMLGNTRDAGFSDPDATPVRVNTGESHEEP